MYPYYNLFYYHEEHEEHEDNEDNEGRAFSDLLDKVVDCAIEVFKQHIK